MVKNPGVVTVSSSWFHFAPLRSRSPLSLSLSLWSQQFSSVLRSRARGKREQHLRSYVIFPFGSSPSARCLVLPFAISPHAGRYIPCSRTRLFSRGENQLQSTDYFESRSPFLHAAMALLRRPGCAIHSWFP